jgi:hypothetical protein
MSTKNMKCNQPQRTPNHPTKSHMVKACQGGKEKLVRFGQQGVKGSPPKENESEAAKARRLAFKERHDCESAQDKLSARYWSCKHKW